MRHPRARRRARLWSCAGAVFATACGGGEEGAPQPVWSGAGAPPSQEPPTAAVTPADTVPRVRAVVAVQLGAFADSGDAHRLRDSLARAGWQAHVRYVVGDTLPRWRVRMAPAESPEMPQLVAAQLAAHEREALLVRDSALVREPAVRALAVNGGEPGMIARVRWAMSPDRDRMLVVENATAIENDPFPDGFVYVGERGAVVMQRNRVWDVAPSPDWRRIAYGRAFMIQSDGRDSVTYLQWAVVAAATNLDAGLVRRLSFPASSMNLTYGFAQPVIEFTHPDSMPERLLQLPPEAAVPVAGGWRVRWSTDGRTLAVGLAPWRQVRDDTPSPTWLAVDAHSSLVRGELERSVRLASVPWQQGPVLDVSVPVDRSPKRFPFAGGGAVESRDGWVVVRSPATGNRPRAIGPGIALAVTRTGRFIAVLAPRADARAGESAHRAMVYEVP